MDADARLEQLYVAHADDVHAYALRRSSPEMADDVVSETFLVAWRRLDDVPDEPLPWLLGVARRVLANRHRGQRRATALWQRLVHHHGLAVERSAREDSASDERVRHALDALRERDRELLLLIAWEGLSVDEAAEALGVRRGAVAMRLHRARQRLADALAAEDVEIELEVRR